MLPIQVALCAVVSVQCMAAVKFGEIVPFPWDRAVVELQKANNPLRRATVKLSYTYDLAGVSRLKLDEPEGLRVLVYQAVNTAILPFMGSHAQNAITLVRSPDNLVEQARGGTWDVVVIAMAGEQRPAGLNNHLEDAGYRVMADNEMYVVALPRARFRYGNEITLQDIHWENYGAPTDVQFPAGEHSPEVQSAVATDIGVVSQPLTMCGMAEVEAGIEGEIASSQSHAAHLSVNAVSPLLFFPSGKYEASRPRRGMALLPCTPFRIAFGLGGWSKGQGKLRLVNLRISAFEITGPLPRASSAKREERRE